MKKLNFVTAKFESMKSCLLHCDSEEINKFLEENPGYYIHADGCNNYWILVKDPNIIVELEDPSTGETIIRPLADTLIKFYKRRKCTRNLFSLLSADTSSNKISFFMDDDSEIHLQ